MTRAAQEPPVLLDGARVAHFAALDAAAGSGGKTTAVVGGLPLASGTAARLVIAEDMVEGGVFLLHCTDEWFTLAAEHYGDAEAAKDASAAAYGDAAIRWQAYRTLSASEAREVETTRAFLREIAEK